MLDSKTASNPATISLSKLLLSRLRVMKDLLPLPAKVLFVGFLISLVCWLSAKYGDTETQHSMEHLPVPILFSAVSLAIAALFINFVKMFAQLAEIERYLLLLFFAICTSALVGFLNHQIYLINKNAFFIDDNLRQRVTSTQLQDREAKLEQSRRIINMCKDVMFDLALVSSPTFGTSDVTLEDEKHTVRVSLNLPNTTIQITKGGVIAAPNQGALIINDSLLVTRGSDRVELSAVPGPSDRVLRPLLNDLRSVKKADLIAVLQYRMELENKYSLPLRDSAVVIPVSLFAYQAAMETVGGSVNYFVPASGFTRAVAFIHSIARFAFFGLFITTLIGRRTNDGKSLLRS